jgi:hypothetical protein
MAQPSASEIAADVVAEFAQDQRALAAWTATLAPDRAARLVMSSPFVRFVTYSVLDGCRLMRRPRSSSSAAGAASDADARISVAFIRRGSGACRMIRTRDTR